MNNDTKTDQQSFDAADVVKRIGQGDSRAEGALFRQYARGLLLMLINRSNDPDLAADLQQETFIVVLNRLREKGINQPEQVKSFIWATANNLFINEYRKNKRRNTWADTERFEYIEDETANTVASLEAEQTGAMVRRMIRSLPVERDREVLYRFYIQSEEKSSICFDLELDPHHFDRVIYRAKSRLKQVLMLSDNV